LPRPLGKAFLLLLVVLTARKNHYTHARGNLSGVHIGVYQPWYSVQFCNTRYKWCAPLWPFQSALGCVSVR